MVIRSTLAVRVGLVGALGLLVGTGCALPERARIDRAGPLRPYPHLQEEGATPTPTTPASAQGASDPKASSRASVLDHTLSLNVGGQFLGEFKSLIRLDSETLGRGTEIDLEDDLGFKTSTENLRFDLEYRFAKRHAVALSYFDLDRVSRRTIDEELQFGDEVFPINIDIAARFDTSVIKLAYTYFFHVRDQYEIGASVGLHGLDYEASLAASQINVSERTDFLAPLPVVGLTGAYAFGDRTRLRFVGEVFSLEFEDYDGTLTDLRLTLDYDLTKHLGVGLGYNRFDFDAGVSGSNARGEFEWAYDGLLLYLRAML